MTKRHLVLCEAHISMADSRLSGDIENRRRIQEGF